jgi:hypothetical protein
VLPSARLPRAMCLEGGGKKWAIKQLLQVGGGLPPTSTTTTSILQLSELVEMTDVKMR